jgi:hypothetical protein
MDRRSSTDADKLLYCEIHPLCKQNHTRLGSLVDSLFRLALFPYGRMRAR